MRLPGGTDEVIPARESGALQGSRYHFLLEVPARRLGVAGVLVGPALLVLERRESGLRVRAEAGIARDDATLQFGVEVASGRQDDVVMGHGGLAGAAIRCPDRHERRRRLSLWHPSGFKVVQRRRLKDGASDTPLPERLPAWQGGLVGSHAGRE